MYGPVKPKRWREVPRYWAETALFYGLLGVTVCWKAGQRLAQRLGVKT